MKLSWRCWEVSSAAVADEEAQVPAPAQLREAPTPMPRREGPLNHERRINPTEQTQTRTWPRDLQRRLRRTDLETGRPPTARTTRCPLSNVSPLLVSDQLPACSFVTLHSRCFSIDIGCRFNSRSSFDIVYCPSTRAKQRAVARL